MKRQVTSTLRRDRALSLGLLGGLLASIAGLTGYIVVPLLTGEEQYLLDAAMSAGFNMRGYSLRYHGTVLLLPSFVASFGGTILLRRWRLTGKTPALKLIGGVIGVPIMTVLITYLVTAFAFGVLAGLSTIEDPISAVTAGFGMIALAGLALVFGMIALAYAMPIVVVGVSLGAIGGSLVAFGLGRVSANL